MFKKTIRTGFLNWIGVCFLLLLPMSVFAVIYPVVPGDPGDLITINALDNWRLQLSVKPSTNLTGPFVNQYFGGTSPSWGSTIHLPSTNQIFGGSYYTRTTPLPAIVLFSLISNTVVTTATGGTVITVGDLGATGLQLTQEINYEKGTRFVTKTWKLRNIDPTTTYTNVRHIHGGDTFFGGLDSAYGFYDSTKNMVYVRNTNFTNWGIMGFYTNPATPASGYFEGLYSTGRTASQNGLLPSTVDATFRDAGYQLQWDRPSLAPGETWTIIAYEVFTAAGGLQVLAPGAQSAAVNSTVTLPFTVQNITDNLITVSVSTQSLPAGWTAAISGPTTLSLDSNASAIVNVAVTIDASVPNGNTADVSLLASGGGQPDALGTTKLTASRNVNLSLTPDTGDFGSVRAGSSTTIVFTVTNHSSGSVTLGTLSTIDPFSITSDSCSGQVLAVDSTCTVSVNFSPLANGNYAENLNIPVTDPLFITYTIAMTGSVGLPTAPTALSATAGNTEVGLRWEEPFDIEPTVGYNILYSTNLDGDYTAVPSGTCVASIANSRTATTCNVTGLTNGTTYYFKVAAINRVGVGVYSTPASATPKMNQAPLSLSTNSTTVPSGRGVILYAVGGSVAGHIEFWVKAGGLARCVIKQSSDGQTILKTAGGRGTCTVIASNAGNSVSNSVNSNPVVITVI